MVKRRRRKRGPGGRRRGRRGAASEAGSEDQSFLWKKDQAEVNVVEKVEKPKEASE